MEFGFHILGCEHLHVMHQCYLCIKHLPKKKSNLTVLPQGCELMLSCAFPGNLEASF